MEPLVNTSMSGLVIPSLLAAVLAAAVPATAQPPRVEPSPELERLHFQLGHWAVASGSVDREGNVVGTREDRALVTLLHDGLLLHHLRYTEAPEDSVYRIWQYHDGYDGRLHDVSFDVVGHFEHRVEVGGDGPLAFEFPEPRAFQDGVPRNWRKTYSDVSPDSYTLTWEYTEDDGETWHVHFVTRFRRIHDTRS